MLKSLAFLAIAANLVVYSLADSSTQEDQTEDNDSSTDLSQAIEEYMDKNGYGDAETEIIKELANSYIELTILCLYNLGRTEHNKNQITSLTPILKLFSLGAFAKDESLQPQLFSILNVKSTDELSTGLPIVDKMINANDEAYTSTVVMKLFTDSNIPFDDNLIQVASDTCNIEMGYADFSNPIDATSTINNWVTEATGQQGDDLISSDEISNKTGIISVSSTDFKAYWSDSLAIQASEDIEFYVSKDVTTTVSALHLVGNIKYAELTDLDSTLVVLPLENDCYMKVLYSNKHDGLMDLVYVMRNHELFSKAMSQGEEMNAHVYLPMDTEMYKTENFLDGIRLSGLVREMIVRDDYYVCDGVYQDSTFCGYMSEMKHEVRFSIQSKSEATETISEDTDDYAKIVVNRPHIDMVMCPIETPHVALMYFGSE